MTGHAVLILMLAVAGVSLVQGWRHAGRRPRRGRGRTGHDQWRRPRARRRPRPVPGCDAYVYWPWNAAGDGPDRSGRPRYVGKALSWWERRNWHAANSLWWPKAYPVPDVQRCADERAALAREWYLIGELNPIDNIRRPRGWVRTRRPTTEIMAGFRLALPGGTERFSRPLGPPPTSTRASGRVTSTSSTGSWRPSWSRHFSGSSRTR